MEKIIWESKRFFLVWRIKLRTYHYRENIPLHLYLERAFTLENMLLIAVPIVSIRFKMNTE